MLIVIFFPGCANELYIIWFKVESLEEVKKAIHVGADAIIVQGREAEGHDALISLLPKVGDLVGDRDILSLLLVVLWMPVDMFLLWPLVLRASA
ncbi:hypothetical protein FF1_034307 [Malus domestica]